MTITPIADTAVDTTRSPVVLKTVADLRACVAAARADGRRVALVPTMGALHDGHMALVRQGLQQADFVIASIFVNPAQFGPNEDFSAYPRTWEADLALLAAHGAQAVFYPSVSEMYPSGFASKISVTGVSEGLCGAARPGHFDGVATVVTKLLLQAMPDIALFGEKDWQQLQVIRRVVDDLNIPVTIVGVPTVRDENGLALSSRNAYLNADQYKIAVRLNIVLSDMAAWLAAGRSPAQAVKEGLARLEEAGFDAVDYLEIRTADGLALPGETDTALRILAAVRLGRARLIDNMAAVRG